MKAFWIRMVNLAAVVGLLCTYNQVLQVRAGNERILKLEAELESTRLATNQLLELQQDTVSLLEEAVKQDRTADQTAAAEPETETAEQPADTAEAESTRTCQDGTYKGTAEGFGGPITVAVTIENDTLTDVSIISADGEDGTFLDMASGIIDTILETQGTDVDTVSGATFSSTGIKNAAIEALEKAAEGT